jgi:hypothetical protein
MKTLRGKNLQLAGIELVMPTVLCIDGRPSRGARTTLTIGYASGYADAIVAPLAAEWLSRYLHRRFSEHGRGPEGDLAAEAFYDKLACEFARESPFLAAIVSPHDATTSGFDRCGAVKPHDFDQRRMNGDVLARFMAGASLVRWTCEGPVRAFINAKTGAAQVAFEPLPGGIELTATAKFHAAARLSKRPNQAIAWYGFGIPIRDPAELVIMLRNEMTEARHAKRAAHV